MTVTNRPYSARLRFTVGQQQKSVQSLSHIRRNLNAADAQALMDGINVIRGLDEQVSGGVFTLSDELTGSV